MDRLVTATLYGALLFVAASAKLCAASPTEVAWPLPRPSKTDVSVAPTRVIDIAGSANLRGAQQGYLLPDGRILFTGDANPITETAVSLLNPSTGQIKVLWRNKALQAKDFLVSPKGDLAWFAADSASWPTKFFVVDLTLERALPVEAVYGNGLDLLHRAIKHSPYWKARVESDGSLLFEWRSWASIANWWGKSPEDWRMGDAPARKPGDGNVYSRALLPSPTQWLKKSGPSDRLAVVFNVSYESAFPDTRPKPRIAGKERYFAPIDDGITFSELYSLPMPTLGIRLQLFNRYLNPVNMRFCGVGNVLPGGWWTSVSGPKCARFQGAYVEKVGDGALLQVLNHGIGVPRAAAVAGSLFAMGGSGELPEWAPYVSLWDVPRGELLAHLALPKLDTGRINELLFSLDAKEVYGLIGYPEPKLYVWRLDPKWTALARPDRTTQ